MGQSFGYNPRTGSMAACCDQCGTPGGTRKRTCRFKVTGDTLRSTVRHTVPWCKAPTLCSPCFQKIGGAKVLHAKCEAPAKAAQAKADAVEAGLDAGESFVVAAYGDWADGVPAGKAGVLFRGRAGETSVLVPAHEYDPERKPRLSDYPDAEEWTP